MRSNLWGLMLGAMVVNAAACSDSNSANVGLAFSTRTTAASAVVQAGDSTVVVRGADTVIIRSVDLVLREIELKRLQDLAGCDSTSSGDNDACEEFTVGIQLVSLPLGNATDKVITVDIAADTYDEVEFEIHKPESSDDAAFIAAHPAFANVSIRVTGSYSQAGTRHDFVFTTDLNKEQEIHLNPPLTVAADGPVNLTIRLDVATWFLSASGAAVVDPATANKGGSNEGLVKNNIEQSIEAFHDNDSDGLDDDHEDDDHGSSHDGPGSSI